jgi:hypothetical protein
MTHRNVPSVPVKVAVKVAAADSSVPPDSTDDRDGIRPIFTP